jgi:hypothetical protein
VEDVSVTEGVSDGVKVIEGVMEDVSVMVIDPVVEGVGDMESVGDCVVERLGEEDGSVTKL